MTILSLEDVDGEEQSSKPEKSEDKEDKKEFSAYISFIRSQFPLDANLRYTALHYLPRYLGSDHSRTDYSPPDLS
jgi:hypothetical protein